MQRDKQAISGAWPLTLLVGLSLAVGLGAAEPSAKPDRAIIPAPVPEAVWKNASQKPITSAEIDELIVKRLRAAGVQPAPVIGDEQFIRRVHLDLCGRLPGLAEVLAFLADKDPQKRAKLIDRLLDSPAYSRHWARYWQDVMSARFINNFQSRILARSFERWMTEQFGKNRPWSELTRDMLTATGVARFDDTEGKSGPAFFLASHMGADATVEQAAETARVFLGIQINCAQCHNHPFDVWKREQFHQLAAYFARVRTRLVLDRESKQIRFIGVQLVSTDRGGFGPRPGGFGRMGPNEYRMPSRTDPRSGTIMHPRSLDGKAPEQGLEDIARRKALVDSLVSKENYWFSAAYVNRIWGVLLGQGFYQPVDDLGPQREAIQGEVLARLAGAFAGTDHDMKNLFRVILNTQAYQRQSRVGQSAAEHLLFASVYPTRLRPGALWASLDTVLGPFDRPGGGPGGPRFPGGIGGFGGLEGMIRTEFGFDPSLKNEDIEGSIPQALTLMNNPQLHQRLKAQGTTLLAGLLDREEKDEKAIEELYLRTLIRRPSANELKKCLAYIEKVGKRGEAYEDLLWALINSTEFQTRR
jgi:hypothetical protein